MEPLRPRGHCCPAVNTADKIGSICESRSTHVPRVRDAVAVLPATDQAVPCPGTLASPNPPYVKLNFGRLHGKTQSVDLDIGDQKSRPLCVRCHLDIGRPVVGHRVVFGDDQ